MIDLFTNFGEALNPHPTGQDLKEKGILQAVTHADKKINLWSTKAYNQFLEYIKMVETFKTEDVRAFAEQNGLEDPPTKRAWGSIVLRVCRANYIKKIGVDAVSNPKAHRAFAAVWQVLK